MKFLCDNCKAKYQIGDDRVAGKTVRMKCRRCGHEILVKPAPTDGSGSPSVLESGSPLTAESLPPKPDAPRSPRTDPRSEVDDAWATTAGQTGAVAAADASAPDDEAPAPIDATRPRSAAGPQAASNVGARAAPVTPAPAAVGAPRPAGPPRPVLGAAALPRPTSVAVGVVTTPAAGTGPLSSRFGPRGPVSNTSLPAVKPTPAYAPALSPRPRAASTGQTSATMRAAGAPGYGQAGTVSKRLNALQGPGSTARPVGTSQTSFSQTSSRTAASLGRPTGAMKPGDPAVGAFARATDDGATGQGGGDGWYVGVAGVPTGPIDIAVVREKAMAGEVDADSLVWREGFGDWLPVRQVAELLDVISTARAVPPPVVAQDRAAVAMLMSSDAAPLAVSVSPAPAVATSPRAQGADAPATTAETPLAAAAAPTPALAATTPHPSNGAGTNGAKPAFAALSDPFGASSDAHVGPEPAAAKANGVAQAPAGAALPATRTAPVSEAPAGVPRRREMHPLAYAFIAMFAAFGAVAAYVLLSRPPLPPPVQGHTVETAAPSASVPIPAPEVAPSAASESSATVVDPSPSAAKPAPGSSAGIAPRAKPSSSAAASAPPEMFGFNNGVAGPTATGPAPAAGNNAAGALSQGEIAGVVNQNQASVRRKCWQPALEARSASAPPNARVNGTLTIGPSGSVDSASASGAEKDFPSLSSCIAARMKGWKFPASGGTQKVAVPFVFAGQ